MLNSASDESMRASAELAGVSALATCLLDDSPDDHCELGTALQAAADSARLAGLDVSVEGADGLSVRASRERLTYSLPALLRLVGGAGKKVRVQVGEEGIVLTGDDTESLPPVAGYLVDALGASIPITFRKDA
jgi:hypothetical protein